MIPSVRERRLFDIKTNKITPEINITGQLRFMVCSATGIGKIITVRAKTRAMFAMFDPITLPSAISGCPVIAESRLTISSGAEVPKATTVSPITRGEILNRPAIAELPLTRISPLYNKSAIPESKKPILIKRACCIIRGSWFDHRYFF